MKTSALLASASLLAGFVNLSPTVCHATDAAGCMFGTSSTTPWYGTGQLTTNQYIKINIGNMTGTQQSAGVQSQPGQGTVSVSGTTYASLTNNTQAAITIAPGVSLCFSANANTQVGDASASMTVGSGMATATSSGFNQAGSEDDEFLFISVNNVPPGGSIVKSGPVNISATN